MYIDDGSGNNLVIEAPAGITGDVNVTFPANDGNPGEYLTTDGNGNLTYASATIGPDGVYLDGQTDGGLLLESSGNAFTSFILPNPSATVSTTFTLPDGNGSKGQVLSTDGNGNLIWTDASSGNLSGSGVATQIAYWTSSSTLSSDSGLYYDPSNTFVGIGTETPGTSLDVASGKITTGSNGTPGALAINSGSGTNELILAAPSGMSSSNSLTLPADGGNTGEVLTTDGSGNLTWQASGSTVEYAVNSPTAYAADQNNLSLSMDNTLFRLSASSNISLTGIDATGVNDGKMIIIVNVCSGDIRLRDQNAGSTATNRIITAGGTVTLKTNGTATLIYDAATQRWRLISTN